MRTPAGEIVKLASNENPLGPSPKVRAAMREGARGRKSLPGWRRFLFPRRRWPKNWVSPRKTSSLGNGSNEIIEFIGHAFLRPGAEMVTSENAFIAYRFVAALFAAKTVNVPDRDYRFDLEAILEAITPRTRVIFIANPNNPTGTLVGQKAIDRFMARVPEDIVVVFDEAYFEYLDDPPDTFQFVRANRNVIVLRTFSKIHALANAAPRLRHRAAGIDPGAAKNARAFQHQRTRPGRRRRGAGRRDASSGNQTADGRGPQISGGANSPH